MEEMVLSEAVASMHSNAQARRRILQAWLATLISLNLK